MTEREGSVIVRALQTLKQYILRMKFKISTGHSALKVLLDKRGLEGQKMHCAEFLMGYNCKNIYRPKKEKVVASSSQ